MTNWGPWIRYEGSGRPEGLQDDQMIKAAFINGFGDIIVGRDPREVGYHLWPGTLAYRVELVEATHVLYGISGSEFTTEMITTICWHHKTIAVPYARKIMREDDLKNSMWTTAIQLGK